MRLVARCVLPLLICAVAAANSLAEPTAKQRAQLRTMWSGLKQAGELYRDGKPRDAAKLLEKVQTQYEAFDDGGDATAQSYLDRVYNSLAGAHASLELDGIRMKPLKKRAVSKPEPDTPKPDTPEPDTPEPQPKPTTDAVSFSQHVAPILLGKCGRCHVSRSNGGFNTGSFAALMRGSDAGRVLFAGDAMGSPLIEVIESGDMPRGGGRVTAAELDTLKKWINQGAKNDAPAADTPLASLTNASAEPVAEAPKVEMVKATRDGVSFGIDIAPVLVSNCIDCHGTNNPRSNFSLATFQSLLKGGDSGPPIEPGRPAGSLLIQKLKGTADGGRMPLNRPALPDDTIAKIEEWIAKGARFDGPSQTANLERVAALVKASTATHEELSEERVALARQNWKLALPGIDNKTVSTRHFHLVGNVGENTLTQLGEAAEAVAPQVAAALKAPEDKPLIKGKLTLFAFDVRYDYSEFGTMVEKRKLPTSWRGHWSYDGVDAYGAVVPSKTGKYSADALVAEQLAGVYVASRGSDVPSWFAEGSGRAVASKLAPDDTRVKAWNDGVAEALAAMTKAEDFQTGAMPPDKAAVAGYHFAKYLMKDSGKYQRLLTSLEDGQPFEAAFAKAYGGSPAQLAGAWASVAGRRR